MEDDLCSVTHCHTSTLNPKPAKLAGISSEHTLTAASRALVLRGTFAPNLFVEVSVLHALGNLILQQVEVKEAVILFDPGTLFPGHPFPSRTATHPDRLGPRGVAPGADGHRA